MRVRPVPLCKRCGLRFDDTCPSSLPSSLVALLALTLDFKIEPMRDRMPRRKLGIRPCLLACPKSRSNGKGSPGAFIGIVEAPDEMSALKAAIEEFGIINPEH